ncbi:hypothetical protein L596_028627 [Steinernema carpocapsae]|uniref:U6 small nuclear RNA (adenine-(43)-N(6))-methyltransferase n=1 Tax=Steinernema carpocapsae TaxID=34508 RepID=A0A4U5LYY2_STECR|nr:hypothetical protein L596_028627 [Steinernema carpocapsae]
MPKQDILHKDNRYAKDPVDIMALARKYKQIRPLCNLTRQHTLKLDYERPEAIRVLSTLLLKEDFNLTVDLPHGRLVPRIPQRLNYICVVRDFIRKNNIDAKDVIGLDVGTGASCIYPLLGVRECGWKFWATEINEKSINFAKKNVEANKLTEEITFVKPDDSTLIQELGERADDKGSPITFVMCNPPFYDATEGKIKYQNNGEMCENTGAPEGNRPAPHSGTVAQESELITEGGEVHFIRRLISESQALETKIKFYTTMMGKTSTLQTAKKMLDELKKETDVRYTEAMLRQGKTHRPVVIWTFDPTFDLKVESAFPVKKPKVKKTKMDGAQQNGRVAKENHGKDEVEEMEE